MQRICRNCGTPIAINLGPGRIKSYCNTKCQRAYNRRRRAIPTDMKNTPRWILDPATINTLHPYANISHLIRHHRVGFLTTEDDIVCLRLSNFRTNNHITDGAGCVLRFCEGTFMEASRKGDVIYVWGRASGLGNCHINTPDFDLDVLARGYVVPITGLRWVGCGGELKDVEEAVVGAMWAAKRRAKAA